MEIVVRSLEWDEYVKFTDEVESKRPIPRAKSKEDAEGIVRDKMAFNRYNMMATKWFLDNIYKNLDQTKFTPAELMVLGIKTIELTTKVRDNELKNLIGFSTGSVTQTAGSTAKPVQSVKKPEEITKKES